MNQMMSSYPQTQMNSSAQHLCGGIFLRSAPSSYANSLAVVNWKGKDAPTVDEVAVKLHQYEESLSSSLVSDVKKLSKKVQ